MSGVGIRVARAVEEALDVSGTEATADGLETGGILTRGEPIGERAIRQAHVVGLALGPFVAVAPHLGREGEVGGDLDEAGPELGVVHVEVVRPHPPLLAHELEIGTPGVRGAVLRAEHPGELLCGDDGHDTDTPFTLGSIEVRAHVVEFSVVPARAVRLVQSQQRDRVVLGEGLDLTAEAVADLVHHRRRGDGHAQVVAQEVGHLPRRLEPWHVGVEIEPIDAFELQGHVPVEYVVDVHCAGHAYSVPARGTALPARQTQTEPGRVGGGREGGLPPSR